MNRTFIVITVNAGRVTVTNVKQRRNGPGRGHYFTPEQIAFILENFAGLGIHELTGMFNRRFGLRMMPEQIRKAAYTRGLSSGNDGRFRPGNIPFNKGKKKWYPGGEETQFKKGNIPKNSRPVGSERINSDGYTEVKTADPNQWRLKHHVIWEAEHGPIQHGHRIVFGDGDKTNLSPDNLIIVTAKQAAVMSKLGLFCADASLTRVGVTIADVKMKITERMKGRKKNDGTVDKN